METSINPHRLQELLKAIMEFLPSLQQLIFFAFFTFYVSTPLSAQPFHKCLAERSNYTANSPYSTNLNTLLRSSVASLAEDESGFYTFTAGKNTNESVNAIALCRGDIQPRDCVNCVKNASSTLVNLCPNQKEAIIWYNECMFRYSNRDINNTMETSPNILVDVENSIGAADIGARALRETLVLLKRKVESGEWHYKYVAESGAVSSSQSMYLLVQCTPDLTDVECGSCLVQIFERLLNCCVREEGVRVFAPSCSMRYQYSPFFGAEANIQPSNPSLIEIHLEAIVKAMGTIALIMLTGLVIFLLFALKKSCYNMIREHGDAKDVLGSTTPTTDEDKRQEMHYISLSALQVATNGFSDANKLGEGGFGPVYKGTLEDGKEIAIKRLSRTSGQGLIEFKNEVTLIARLQHKNLVRLLGCCLENDEKLLVYEYMPNKSLDVFLFDSSMRAQLDWQTRFSIINGIARGILYLHEDSRLKIIHRDLKASNILLDDDINPKISDFGMARLLGGNQNEANTNRIVGTYGYMAPEYAMHGLFSVKSDVFSFGVLLLEIIGGRKNSSFHYLENGETLLTFAWKLWYDREGMKVMDPLLSASCVEAQVLRSIHIGLLCVQKNRADRPTMSSVVFMLASETGTLPNPKQPAFSVGQLRPKSSDKICSLNEMSLSNLSPR